MQKGKCKSSAPKIGNNGGRAFALIEGQRVYLKTQDGETALYGTPQAREAYHRLLSAASHAYHRLLAAPSVPDSADVVQMLKQQNVMLLALLQKQGIVSLESQSDTI